MAVRFGQGLGVLIDTALVADVVEMTDVRMVQGGDGARFAIRREIIAGNEG